MGALFVFLGVFFLLAILVKIPVGFSLGIGATATFLYAHLPVINMAQGAFSALDSTSYLAIPFFMIGGMLMEYSGISKSLLDLVESIIGRLKGAKGHCNNCYVCAFWCADRVCNGDHFCNRAYCDPCYERKRLPSSIHCGTSGIDLLPRYSDSAIRAGNYVCSGSFDIRYGCLDEHDWSWTSVCARLLYCELFAPRPF